MPYEIRKINNGYKVFIKDTNKAFSDNPLTKETAEKQLTALNINTHHKSYFEDYLKKEHIDSNLYLQIARYTAQEKGYNPKYLEFSDNNKYKLKYFVDNKWVYFGSPTYNDFILWGIKESKGEYPKGTAIERRRLYRIRSGNIKGNWKNDKYSKNNLAREILW